jgi:hypothetical protein
MDRIRTVMGVCPQFDVLWGELTGAEHLNIYGHVKGVPFAEVGSLPEPGMEGRQPARGLVRQCRCAEAWAAWRSVRAWR